MRTQPDHFTAGISALSRIRGKVTALRMAAKTQEAKDALTQVAAEIGRAEEDFKNTENRRVE